MSSLQIVVLLTALAVVVVVAEFVRRRELNEGFALLWIGAGIGVVGFAVGRPLVDDLAEAIGVTYGATMVLAGGLLFLGFVAMSLSLHVSRLERKVEALAEEIAFLHHDREASDRT